MESGRKYLEEKGYEIVDGEGYTEDDIIRQIPGCDAMIVRTAKITKKILDAADSLKVIARHGAGFDGVDLKAADGSLRADGKQQLRCRDGDLLYVILF